MSWTEKKETKNSNCLTLTKTIFIALLFLFLSSASIDKIENRITVINSQKMHCLVIYLVCAFFLSINYRLLFV